MILPTIISENSRIHGRRVAVLDDERTFTWTEFADRVARAAGVLRSLGLYRGERFAIVMRNSFRFAELLWAGYWSGIVPVPVNWRLSPLEIGAILEDCDAKLVAAEAEFLPMLNSPALSPWRTRLLTVEAASGRQAQYETLIAAATPAPQEQVDAHDDAILLYTSGTTGRGKGVRLTHHNILSNAWQLGLAIGVRPSDVYLHVAPMFHSADLNGTICFLLGGSHVYVPQFMPEIVAAAIERHHVTISNWVPTMVKMMADAPAIEHFDLTSLRLILYGSSPMPAEWLRAARQKLPEADLHGSYGLTETSPILTTLDHASHLRCFQSGDPSLLKSVGKPMPGLEMRIVDDRDQPLPLGKTGEIVVRGPQLSPGYYKRDEDNKRAFRGGWFHTGDVGRFDDDGNLYLVDRIKDVIITGGENVYSTEVEIVLYRHPGISEAAVIGVPDDRLGEALFAVIVPKSDATLTAEGVVEHCRAYIGGYKIPRQMVFVDALPRTALGKVQKGVLRKTYANPADWSAKHR